MKKGINKATNLTWKIFYILALIFIIGMGVEMLTESAPPGFKSPDVNYQAAKILMISRNTSDLFLDPTNGIPSIYPYLYALIGSIPAKLFGTGPNTVLKWLSFLSFGLFVLSVYLIGKRIRNHYSAIVLVCACLTMQSFPSKMIDSFLPVPFQLALGVMVLGLYLCLILKNKYSLRLLLLSAITCGIGISIWPPFIFAMPVLLLLIQGWKSRVLFCAFSFTIVCIVCMPQYIFVYNSGYIHPYKESGALSDLLKIPFIGDNPASLMAFVCCALYIFTAISIKSDRHNRGYLLPSIVSLAIIIPTYLLFAPAYGARLQRFLNIILFMPFAHYLITQKSWRIMPGIALLVVGMYFVGLSEYWMIARAHGVNRFVLATHPIVDKLNELVPDKNFVFCATNTYQDIIMGNTIKYALAPHRNFSYYAMDKPVSDRMLKDLIIGWTTKSEDSLQIILNKYGIHYFLIYVPDDIPKDLALYRTAATAPVAFRSADQIYAIVKIR